MLNLFETQQIKKRKGKYLLKFHLQVFLIITRTTFAKLEFTPV